MNSIDHYLSPDPNQLLAAKDVQPTLHYRDARAEIHRVIVGPMDNNVFILRCRQTGEAALIDAANEHDRLLELCRSLNVRQVLETHGHWDHIQAVPQLRDAGYEVHIDAADSKMLPSYDKLIDSSAPFLVGKLVLMPVNTPGHTPGSVCFKLEGSKLVFSGDTLFPGGPGATNFEGGDFQTILKSIEDCLFSPLDADTIVLPGHGNDTTIGKERPHIQKWADRGW